MKYLKLFENFQNDETLYIFDFDDTLVDSPSFEELAIEYLTENQNISDLIKRSLYFVSKEKSDLRIENGRIYIEDPNQTIEPKGNWVRKGLRVYMVTPNVYHFLDISLPKKVKELSELYKQVQNKAIVTGRMVDLKEKVIESLEKFGLELPNYGLFCFPSKDDTSQRVAEWKATTIVQLLRDTGFKKAKFYDDKPKWVKRVVQEVKKELPEVDFEGVRVY
jgi:phosphoglycolate phosphatase-like HAD superfamily hydrolase